MPDIASIGAAISSLKTATEIAKLIKNSNVTLADAEVKLKLAELIGALADTKMEVAEIQDLLREKDRIILELEDSINKRKKLTYDGKVYFAEGDDVPFCSVCYEKDGKHHHLTYYQGGQNRHAHHLCKVCASTFR